VDSFVHYCYICQNFFDLFSKACEYGIRAAIYIAGQSAQNRRVGLKEVAQEIDSPEAYTSKILQKLVKGEIIISEKGPTGGFLIEAAKLSKTTLASVVIVIDGDSIFQRCGLGLKQCNESKPCPLHYKFKDVRENLKMILEETTIEELSEKTEVGLGFLKM